jgi:hypothetical protein
MQLRIPVTIDPRINVGHLGARPYNLADYTPTHESLIDGKTVRTSKQIEEMKALLATA